MVRWGAGREDKSDSFLREIAEKCAGLTQKMCAFGRQFFHLSRELLDKEYRMRVVLGFESIGRRPVVRNFE
jgi:hypothetical protein